MKTLYTVIFRDYHDIERTNQFGCEIAIVLIPTIDEILNSPLLDGEIIFSTSSDEQ